MRSNSIVQPSVTSIPKAPAAAAVAVIVGVSAVCWVVTVQQMRGMDMGVTTPLGSFPHFMSVWVPMMAAMMLPGTTTATVQQAQAGRRTRDVPLYLASYLGVWTLIGVAVFALYQPHGTVAAGAVTVAAGVYELTPTKRHFRQMCRDYGLSDWGSSGWGSSGWRSSGWRLGTCCVGSSIGLMVMMVGLGVMNLAWMGLATVIVLAQKLFPPRAAVDIPVALAIVALGIVILAAPSIVPGLVPSMHPMAHLPM